MSRTTNIFVLAMLLALTAGTQQARSEAVLKVQQVANGCYLTFNGVHVTDHALLERARLQRGQRIVLIYGKDAPYKCVGAAIITLQEAGVMDIDARPSLPK